MSVATADPVRSDVPFDLRRGSLRLLTTAANAVGIQAPVAGVSFLPALMAGIVGTAGPLSFAVATVAMLFVAYAFVTFTRAFNSAGSVYAFNGRALGRAVGFVSVWLLVAVYLSYAASVYASNANALRALLALGESGSAGGGIPIVAFLTAHWIVLAVGCWALTIAIAHRSVRTASTVILACEGVALILVAAVAAAVVLHGGYHHHGLSKVPLVPGAPGLAVLGLGVVFAFTGFSGFEVAATLGEEARLPVRVVPASMVAALLLSGGVYTVMAWVEAGAFSSPAAFAASAAHGVPLVLIAQRFAGPPLAILVLVAAIISGFGAQLACINGATRLLYALGRDRVAPHRLAMVGARYGTPTMALAVVAVLSIAAVLPLIGGEPLAAFVDLATYGADCIIVVYLLTVVAALVWSVRTGRRHPVHLLVLSLGAVILAAILRSTVLPVPVFPFDLLLLLTAVTVAVAGILLVVAPGLRRRLAQAPLLTVGVSDP